MLHGTEGKADIIIANIIADIIIMLLQDIPGKLKSGGIFLASGIIEERQNDVSAAASKSVCVSKLLMPKAAGLLCRCVRRTDGA